MKFFEISCLMGALLLLFPATPLPARQPPLPDVVAEPAAVRLEVDDLRRLADVVRLLRTGATDTVALIRDRYFAAASPGLRAYLDRYGVTPAMVADALSRQPGRYAELDAFADTILARRPEFVAAFSRLKDLYPAAAYPPVWFFAAHSPPVA